MNEHVRSSYPYAYVAVFTNESGGDISTNTSQDKLIEGNWYREFRQEIVFCACVCTYAYVASHLLSQ